MLSSVFFVVVGILSGFISGLFGIGAGSIRIPLLNLIGVPIINCFALNLAVIPFSCLTGAYILRRNIDYNIAKYMILGGLCGTIISTKFVVRIPPFYLSLIFLFESFIVISGIYIKELSPTIAKRLKPDARHILPGAFIINFITGLRGGVGGSVFSPFLLSLGIGVHTAVATSLVTIIFTALAGAYIFLNKGYLILKSAFILIVSSIVGSAIGGKVSKHIKPESLKKMLSIFVLLLGISMVIKNL